jgi:hypothetical protein
MEEEKKDKKLSKGAGIAIGLGIGFFILPAVCSALFMLPFFSGDILVAVMVLVYIALIVLCFVKGYGSIGLGLILSVCIPLLIFGGCLLLFF